ncbi:PadR family transcriptional regulator [Haloactinospora alba]|uniref:PadR family transcriptional regulator n=1 Tax=Haloactinospora alba TaxID=405555 RepID=A0A543NFE4_9ACTN|nr:PadR family transcriptional regulator [Haloactinospora alba]TQN30536.1 PadR family transcriptional regulator [Haloactinospora alba]
MSTIFGHGRLRLYLLKLLDESPRHGYEIISLLRDRFLGVYSPSPGTIYPRLARLEEEGLVTHEEVNGRKVYRLTDQGRAELDRRSSDLEDLEREISDSVRDVAHAVKEDVRDTISSLREELKGATGSGRRSAEDADEDTAAAGSDREGAGSGSGRGGSWWGRDWTGFAGGFGSWGRWTRRESSGNRPDLEQTLQDFSDRVRDVAREAGQFSESATQNLRRVLDDTIDVIRRDVSSWGPPSGTEQSDSGDTGSGREAGGEAGDTGRAPNGDPSGGTRGTEARGPFAQPPASHDSGDPWDAAVREDSPGSGRDDTTGPEGGRGA